MHIPDGLISPYFYLPAAAVAAPLVGLSARRMNQSKATELLPSLSVFTALAFAMSTLVVPLPGGTSAHALGVALLALAFGPSTAFVAYTLVLLLQALVVGAGGITTLPVNAIAVGFVSAHVAVAIHAALRRFSEMAAVLAAVWISVMLSAFLIAVALGVQPMIAQGPDGTPRFFPFGPSVTLPALLLPHALIGAGEAALTWMILAHARKRGWLEART